jgi:hypothetical protein
VIVVSPPNVAAITAAYALIKRVSLGYARRHFRILVSMTRRVSEARAIYDNMARVTGSHRLARLDYAGCVPVDERLRQASRLGQPVAGTVSRLAGGQRLSDAGQRLAEVASRRRRGRRTRALRATTAAAEPAYRTDRDLRLNCMYNAAGQLNKDQLVQRFAPLVRRIACHLLARLPASVQLDDLVQNGMLGLLDAMGRFEAGLGSRFETYAAQRVRGAMLDGLRENDWLPRSLRRNHRRIEAAIANSNRRRVVRRPKRNWPIL